MTTEFRDPEYITDDAPTFTLCKRADERTARRFAEMLSDDHGEHVPM